MICQIVYSRPDGKSGTLEVEVFDSRIGAAKLTDLLHEFFPDASLSFYSFESNDDKFLRAKAIEDQGGV